MTGQELIKKIEEENLQDRHLLDVYKRQALNYAITHKMKSERYTLTLKYLVAFSGNFIAA